MNIVMNYRVIYRFAALLGNGAMLELAILTHLIY